MKNSLFKWIRLDNAGKIFPGQNMRRWSNVFRIAVELKEEIDPELLKRALKTTLDRIPSFKVRMRKGFFWNYFEINEMDCPVNSDISNHCYRINFKENNGYLFRVYYHSNRIAVDIYHSLCDGHGGAVFVSTLVGQYLQLKGCQVSYNHFVLDADENVKKEELEDAYVRYASSDEKYVSPEKHVYHKRGTKLPIHLCNYTVGTMSVEKLRALSKSYGVTITELLAAVLVDIHYRKQLLQGKTKKEVSAQIPVDLRKAFPSRTLRNFVLCLIVQINPNEKEYTFEEILKTVSQQLKTVNNAHFLNSLMTRNVEFERNLVKYVPRAIKNFFVGIGFRINAEFSTSTLLSNLGVITLPDEIKNHIERFSFFTGPGIVNGARCGAVTCGDNLVFTFSNCYKENDIEKEFFSRMVEMGIPVKIETNREDDIADIEGIEKGDESSYPRKIHIPTRKDRITRFRPSALTFKERLERVFHV